MINNNLTELPKDLPVPMDDGAAAHLEGMSLAKIALACNFRDHHLELNALGVGVFGLSTQDTEYQREVRDRLHLPFQLLSDPSLQLKSALRLPTFRVQGVELYKRLTLIIETGKIEKVFYPVFPPDKNAEEVLAWLKQHVQIRHA